MAAGNFTVYGPAKARIGKGEIDLDSHTFVCTLHSNAYTPNANTHGTWADVKASELATGNGYTQGGVALAVTVTDNGDGSVKVDSSVDPSWLNSTLTAKYAIVTRRAGASLNDSDFLLGYLDLETGNGTGLSSTNGTFQVTWHANGMFRMQ